MPNKQKLGVYLAPQHDPEQWKQYLKDIDPLFVRVLMPGDSPTDLISQVHQCAPEASISLRWWDLDDGGEPEKRKKLEDPMREAPRIVAEMNRRLTEMETVAERNQLPFPRRDQFWFNTINEPPTWEHNMRDKIANWSWLAAREADTKYNVGMMCLELAVGHPEEWPPEWGWADEVMYNVMKHGGILALHEYWQPEGPLYEWGDGRKDWGALAGRYQHLTGMVSHVPIVITECGVDGRIYNRHATPDTGYRKFMDPIAYAAQMGTYLQQVKKDSRILSVLPFITDYHDNEWASFDTLPAREAFVRVLKALEASEEDVYENDLQLPYVPGSGDKHYRVSQDTMDQLIELVTDISVILKNVRSG